MLNVKKTETLTFDFNFISFPIIHRNREMFFNQFNNFFNIVSRSFGRLKFFPNAAILESCLQCRVVKYRILGTLWLGRVSPPQ